MRIGAAGFIVPFMFVYQPAMLMIGDWPAIIQSFVTASLGCLVLAAGLHGYLVRPSKLWESVLLVIAALGLIDPGLVTDVIGLAILVVVAAIQYATRGDTVPVRPGG